MSSKFRRLAEGFWVASQIGPAELKDVAALGVAVVINNRPDHEEPGQPTGAEIEDAARKAGLAYVEIPVESMNIAEAQLDALQAMIASAKGPLLAYCRTGTRSTVLRAMALARAGAPIDALISEAAQAGYDLEGLRSRLEAMSS